MAQTIKHRRGKLESIASITPINGELIIASGSDLSVHQEGLLFVGVEGNVLTPSNKILTGSATLDVTGGSFDHSVDGIPYYETDAKKLHILGHGGNTNVEFTTNSLDLRGSGIVSSSSQVSELASVNDSTITLTAGDGLKTGGSFTLNASGDSTITFDIDASDFAGTGLEADGSENLRIAAAAAGNGLTGGAGSALSIDLDGSTLSVGASGLKAGDALLNTSLNSFTASNANTSLNSATGSFLTAAGISDTAIAEGEDSLVFFDGTDSGVKREAIGDFLTAIAGANLSVSSNQLVGVAGDITGVTAGDGLSGGGSSGAVTLTVEVDDSTIETNSDALRVKDAGITLAKQANMAADRIQGRANGGGAGAPQALTATQVRTIINVEDGATADQTGAEIATALNADLGGNFTIGNQSSDTATFSGGVTVAGDLTVNGTTTYISSSNLNIGDNILELNYAGTAADAGILVKDAVSTGTSGSLLWDASEDYWIAGALGSEDIVVLATATQTLTNKTINGSQLVNSSVANTKLANSAITISGTSVSLGGAITDETLFGGVGVISGSSQVSLETVTGGSGIQSGSILNADLAGSIANSKLSNSAVTISGTSVSLGGSITDETLFGGTGVVSGSSQVTDLTTHKETVSGASSYAVDHNLGEQYPIVQCWNTATSQQELPNSVTTNSTNRVTVDFSTTFAGIIIVKK